MATEAELLPEAKALHELGYASLLVDFRGSGGSAGAATTIGVSEADDVAAAFAYARRTWPGLTVVLFGQSMGGTAVLRAVIVHGLEPPAVILACPFDRLVTTVGNRFGSMGLPAFPAAGLLVFWGGVQHGFNGFRHNPVDYAKRVRCPVLLLQGDLDPRVTPAQARAIFANLAGEKYFELLLGVGHENHATSNPEQWKKAVQQFLGTLKR